MSVVVPPPVVRPDEQEELEALIRAARARQRRRRRIGAAALVVLLAGSAIAVYSIAGGKRPAATRSRGPATFVASATRCGVRVNGVRILRAGRLVYREPVARTFGHQIQCSGSTVWVVFFNGVASSQEAYFGVRSGDRGHTWNVVFAERFFGVKAPHQLDDYLGVWTLHGPRDAYFMGSCPACGFGTVSLWVTEDAGRTFRRYAVPALRGYGPVRLRVAGRTVSIVTRTHKTVTVHLG
jgi:hypothetical protein